MFPQERVKLHTLHVLTCSAQVCQTLKGYQISDVFKRGNCCRQMIPDANWASIFHRRSSRITDSNQPNWAGNFLRLYLLMERCPLFETSCMKNSRWWQCPK
jgi:hypothetical protein